MDPYCKTNFVRHKKLFIAFIGDFKKPRRQRQRKRHLKYKIALLALLRGYSNSLHLCNVAEPSWNRIGRKGVQVQTENDEFGVMCSRSPQNFKFGHFTLLFCRRTVENVPKFIAHVQGHCFAH